MQRSINTVLSILIVLTILVGSCNKRGDSDYPQLEQHELTGWWYTEYWNEKPPPLWQSEDMRVELYQNGSYVESVYIAGAYRLVDEGTWHTINDTLILVEKYQRCSLAYKLQIGSLFDTLTLSGYCRDTISVDALLVRD